MLLYISAAVPTCTFCMLHGEEDPEVQLSFMTLVLNLIAVTAAEEHLPSGLPLDNLISIFGIDGIRPQEGRLGSKLLHMATAHGVTAMSSSTMGIPSVTRWMPGTDEHGEFTFVKTKMPATEAFPNLSKLNVRPTKDYPRSIPHVGPEPVKSNDIPEGLRAYISYANPYAKYDRDMEAYRARVQQREAAELFHLAAMGALAQSTAQLPRSITELTVSGFLLEPPTSPSIVAKLPTNVAPARFAMQVSHNLVSYLTPRAAQLTSLSLDSGITLRSTFTTDIIAKLKNLRHLKCTIELPPNVNNNRAVQMPAHLTSLDLSADAASWRRVAPGLINSETHLTLQQLTVRATSLKPAPPTEQLLGPPHALH